MLTKEQKKMYKEKGYVIIENLFTHSELNPIIEYAKVVISSVAKKLYSDKLISNLYEDLDYTQRLIAINQEYSNAAIVATLQRKMGKPLFDLWNDDKLMAIVQELLGEDIDGHPFWTLRSQVPNEKLLTVPWHQDAAYLKDGASPTLIFWIPLTNASKDSGCMEIIPTKSDGREDRLYKHKVQNNQTGYENSWYVELDEEIDILEIVTCEMSIGSVLLFNESIVHRSLNNSSNNTRWSLDIRYQQANGFSGTNQKSIPLKRKTGFSAVENSERNHFIVNKLCDVPEPNYPTNFGNNMWWLDRWTKNK